MTDPNGSPNHDTLPTPLVSLHHTCICVMFIFSSPDPYSAIHCWNTEPTFIWEENTSPLLIASMLTRCGPLQSFLLMTVCKNRTSSRMSTMDIVGGQVVTDGVGTDGWLLCSSGMTSCLSCGGESVLQIVGAVGGVVSMLLTVDINVYAFAMICTLCPAPNLPIPCSCWFLDNHGMAFTSMNARLAIEICIYTHIYHDIHEHFEITNICLHLPPMSVFESAVLANHSRLTWIGLLHVSQRHAVEWW